MISNQIFIAGTQTSALHPLQEADCQASCLVLEATFDDVFVPTLETFVGGKGWIILSAYNKFINQ